MTFYDADGFIDWQSDLFVGGLASEYLVHFRGTGDGLEELDPLLEDEGWRVRDVTTVYHDYANLCCCRGPERLNCPHRTQTGRITSDKYLKLTLI